MIRRMQLLGSESRAAVRMAAAGGRVWDGLLRDNKVIPSVLAILALLVFAWIIAGALIGNPGEEEGEEVASQASQARASQDSNSGNSETPAPGVENRDTESYSAFEKKDPFRQVIPKADEDDGDGGGDNGDTNGGMDRGGEDNSNGDQDDGGGASGGDDAGRGGGAGQGDDAGGGGDRDGGGNGVDRDQPGGGQPGDDTGQGGDQGIGTGQNGDAGQGDRGGLFESGGDLIVP